MDDSPSRGLTQVQNKHLPDQGSGLVPQGEIKSQVKIMKNQKYYKSYNTCNTEKRTERM